MSRFQLKVEVNEPITMVVFPGTKISAVLRILQRSNQIPKSLDGFEIKLDGVLITDHDQKIHENAGVLKITVKKKRIRIFVKTGKKETICFLVDEGKTFGGALDDLAEYDQDVKELLSAGAKTLLDGKQAPQGKRLKRKPGNPERSDLYILSFFAVM